MDQKYLRYLYNELPNLVEKQIITGEDAERIKSYYGEYKDKNWLRIALAIFGTLGAILIGTGIILLLGRNWADLPRSIRTILSLLPMLIAQVIAGWVVFNNKQSAAWSEGAASFLMLTVGSSIALIGQTYHIPGSFDNFLITWSLLVLPLVYILNATVPAIFYITGITIWSTSFYYSYPYGFWLLIALLIPYIWSNFRKDKYSNSSVFLLWSVMLACGVTLISIISMTDMEVPGLWIVVFSSYFTFLYLADKVWFDGEAMIWQRPFKITGNLGILVLSFIFSFKNTWDDLSFTWDRYMNKTFRWDVYYGLIVCLLLLLISICLLILPYIRKSKKNITYLLYGIAPVLALSGFLMIYWTRNTDLVTIIYSMYLLFLGITTLANGITSKRMGITNGGMLILSALILQRFFDAEWSFVARGIAFIIIGAGFMLSNYLIWRKRKGEV